MAKAKKNKASGFTLIEILTALVIGTVLMGGAISIMVNSKDTYEVQDDLARLQENARFAVNLLTEDLRMAGFFGCGGRDETKRINHVVGSNGGSIFDTTSGLEGLDNYVNASTWQPSTAAAYIDGVGVNFLPGNDAITIRYLLGFTPRPPRPSNSVLMTDMSLSHDNLVVDQSGGLQAGQVVGISDCGSTDIFQITGVDTSTNVVTHDTASLPPATPNPSPGNVDGTTFFSPPLLDCGATNCFSKPYSAIGSASDLHPAAKLMPLRAVRYFLQDDNGDGSPSLHRLVIIRNATGSSPQVEKLVDGIDSLQFTYGEDTDGDNTVDTYVTANAVTNWSKVFAVRFGILLHTVDAYGHQIDNQIRNVNGEIFPAQNDNRRRRLFTSTVFLRNVVRF